MRLKRSTRGLIEVRIPIYRQYKSFNGGAHPESDGRVCIYYVDTERS